MREGREEKVSVERHRYGALVIFEVSKEEMDQLESEASSISEDSSFAITCLSFAVSFAIALATTKIDPIQKYVVFWIVTIIGFLGGAYFGIRWFSGRKKHGNIIRRIRERGVGPLGDDRRQIGPEELAGLPGEESKSAWKEKQ